MDQGAIKWVKIGAFLKIWLIEATQPPANGTMAQTRNTVMISNQLAPTVLSTRLSGTIIQGGYRPELALVQNNNCIADRRLNEPI